MRPSDSPEQAAAATPLHDRAELAQSALENLFDVSPDAIFVTDAQGVIRGANPRAAELFGHTQAELIGQPIENLVPARFRGRHPSHRDNYNAHPRARQMGAAMNLFGLRKDGTEFPVDIMLKPVKTASGPVVLSFVRDVSEQRAAMEALRPTIPQASKCSKASRRSVCAPPCTLARQVKSVSITWFMKWSTTPSTKLWRAMPLKSTSPSTTTIPSR